MSLAYPASLAPLGVYIHWPYCARICPYCDFNVVRDRGRAVEEAALVEAIAQDLAAHAALTGPARLVSIFLGGGTPSLMHPGDAERLIDLARSLWTADAALEVTLEANPTDAEALRFDGFARAGVNRLSLGVQALDDQALEFLGRNHDAGAAVRAVQLAGAIFPRLSLDLMYALPGQTAQAWAQTLVQADALGAEHVSAYQLTIEPSTPFGRAVRRGRFAPADPERAATLYETTQAVLEGLGYSAYEVSNHARGMAARARHNLVYWRGEAYVGVGPGAHGRLTPAGGLLVDGRSTGGRLATHAEPRIDDYLRRVAATERGWADAERLDAQTIAQERLLTGLRIDEGVALAGLEALGELPAAHDLISSGLLRLEAGRLIATASGRLVLDRVTAELLA